MINDKIMVFESDADFEKAMKLLYANDMYDFSVGLNFNQAVEVLVDIKNASDQWQSSSMNC